jgi:hypothetical protein
MRVVVMKAQSYLFLTADLQEGTCLSSQFSLIYTSPLAEAWATKNTNYHVSDLNIQSL